MEKLSYCKTGKKLRNSVTFSKIDLFLSSILVEWLYKFKGSIWSKIKYVTFIFYNLKLSSAIFFNFQGDCALNAV